MKTLEDFTIAPAEILHDSLEELGMSSAEFAKRCALPVEVITQILRGDTPVTEDHAQAFAKVLRVPARFWLNLEANYRINIT